MSTYTQHRHTNKHKHKDRLKSQAFIHTCIHNDAHVYSYRQINMLTNTKYSQKSSILLLKNKYSAVLTHIHSHTQTEKSLHISIHTYTHQLTHIYKYEYTHKHIRDTHTQTCATLTHTRTCTHRQNGVLMNCTSFFLGRTLCWTTALTDHSMECHAKQQLK